MTLNVAKTESMAIASRLARLQGQRIQITHNGTVVKSVDSHKLLDLVHDEHLTWNLHIYEVCTKVLKRINLQVKSLIQLIFDYACVIRGATPQCILDRILK